jgi:hypothetical protein
MKTFFDYLAENKKVYQFKISVAGDHKGMSDNLHSALTKYGVKKFSEGKRTPIQESPLEFPNMQNIEVVHFETDLTYPTTPAVLEEYLGSICNVPRSHIRVRNLADPVNTTYAETSKKTEVYTSLLDTEQMESVSGQEFAGQNRVMSLLKELEVARKENPYGAYDISKTEKK